MSQPDERTKFGYEPHFSTSALTAARMVSGVPCARTETGSTLPITSVWAGAFASISAKSTALPKWHPADPCAKMASAAFTTLFPQLWYTSGKDSPWTASTMRRTYGAENSSSAAGEITPASGSAMNTPSTPAALNAWA